MGRDSTGKHQESGQLKGNQTQAGKDYAGRDKAVGQYDASVDSLAKNPGYSPTDLQAMRAEQGDQISAIHGNDATQLRQNAAETGNANDAGLYSQLRAVSDARSRDAAMGNTNIAGQQAQQVLETRRSLPGMRFQPAQLYGGSASNLTNSSTALINGRQQADQTTPLWAQIGMTAMNNASQAMTAAKG